MKKIILTALMAGTMLTTLAGCENAAVQETPPHAPAQLEQVSMRAEHGYTKLRYGGMDVNPQNYYTHYDVDDKGFVNEIWDALNYVEWAEYDGKSTANVTIELIFTDENGGAWRFDIDPNGIGGLYSDDFTAADGISYERVEPIYFTVPSGVYENISRLLTEYSAEHFTPNITIETIKGMAECYESLTFLSVETHFQAITAETGNFTDEWMLDEWAEITLEDGSLPQNSISIYCGMESPCVSIYPVDLFAAVNYQGRTQAYSFSEEIADIIQQQVDAFRETYE